MTDWLSSAMKIWNPKKSIEWPGLGDQDIQTAKFLAQVAGISRTEAERRLTQQGVHIFLPALGEWGIDSEWYVIRQFRTKLPKGEVRVWIPNQMNRWKTDVVSV